MFPIFFNKKDTIDVSNMDNKNHLLLVILNIIPALVLGIGGIYVLIMIALGKW